MCPIFQNEEKSTLDGKEGRKGERVRLGCALMHGGSEKETQCTQDKCLGRFFK